MSTNSRFVMRVEDSDFLTELDALRNAEPQKTSRSAMVRRLVHAAYSSNPKIQIAAMAAADQTAADAFTRLNAGIVASMEKRGAEYSGQVDKAAKARVAIKKAENERKAPPRMPKTPEQVICETADKYMPRLLRKKAP